MNSFEQHIQQTKYLLSLIDINEICEWLLMNGYYPEQYVLPPCFRCREFQLGRTPFTGIRIDKLPHFAPPLKEIIEVSFPKSSLTDRVFGVFHPQIYHDLVWNFKSEWPTIVSSLFRPENKIYSYSFPIPLTKKRRGRVGNLRAGRMIYEFLEMAENALVIEAHKYSFVVKSDIKNFYPSIYTHSIAWAMHGKNDARADRNNYKLIGNRIDKLCSRGNDGCTNGIPVGSAVSDLIAEILLSAIDTELSSRLSERNIEFAGVRYKDDYRFLCHSRGEGEMILKELQKILNTYTLNLNENKTKISTLPEGLYREWTKEYELFTLKNKETIKYKEFEQTFRQVLRIDEEYPGTGVIDKFLSEIVTKKYQLKLSLNLKEAKKTISLLLMLKDRRNKALPAILGTIELIYIKSFSPGKSIINEWLTNLITQKFEDEESNLYDLLWLTYFVKSNDLFIINWPRRIRSPLLKSIKSNNQKYFTDASFKLYTPIKKSGKNGLLLEHIAMFPNEN